MVVAPQRPSDHALPWISPTPINAASSGQKKVGDLCNYIRQQVASYNWCIAELEHSTIPNSHLLCWVVLAITLSMLVLKISFGIGIISLSTSKTALNRPPWVAVHACLVIGSLHHPQLFTPQLELEPQSWIGMAFS